jgi:hypothetical protein
MGKTIDWFRVVESVDPQTLERRVNDAIVAERDPYETVSLTLTARSSGYLAVLHFRMPLDEEDDDAAPDHG